MQPRDPKEFRIPLKTIIITAVILIAVMAGIEFVFNYFFE